MLRHGVWPTSDLFPLIHHANPQTVIDVGANCGQFAGAVLLVRPMAKVICFEPDDESRDRLMRTFAGLNVQVYGCAVGNEDGACTLHVTRQRDSSSTLLPTERQVQHGGPVVASVPVAIHRLDTVLAGSRLEPLVMLKLDIQGGEAAALRGASRILASVASILCEVSLLELYQGQPLRADIEELVSGFGFRTSEPSVGRGDQRDVLYVR